MCEGYWDVRLRRWVRVEELGERDQETPQTVEAAIPSLLSVEPKRKQVAALR